MKKYLDGLKFGMLLQLAVGPMCLMVFSTARNDGFLIALTLVFSIALVDAFYIILAGLGVSKILDNPKLSKLFKILGSLVLMIFGINIVLNAFNINIIPGLNLKSTSSNIFIQGLILTLSNPITIVFWGSLLTTKIIEDKLNRKEIAMFSAGLVSSTLIFLTFVALLGTMLSNFISENISSLMNVIIGVLIIFWGIKMLVKDEIN